MGAVHRGRARRRSIQCVVGSNRGGRDRVGHRGVDGRPQDCGALDVVGAPVGDGVALRRDVVPHAVGGLQRSGQFLQMPLGLGPVLGGARVPCDLLAPSPAPQQQRVRVEVDVSREGTLLMLLRRVGGERARGDQHLSAVAGLSGSIEDRASLAAANRSLLGSRRSERLSRASRAARVLTVRGTST